MKDDLYFRRQDFNGQSLSEKEIPLNPHALFRIWLDEALLSDEPEPNAMNIVSVSEEGNPHARIVLLRQADDSGFTFFTNYNSGKGKHWSKNPKAAATFFWPSLYRQVRIEGNIEKISREEKIKVKQPSVKNNNVTLNAKQYIEITPINFLSKVDNLDSINEKIDLAILEFERKPSYAAIQNVCNELKMYTEVLAQLMEFEHLGYSLEMLVSFLLKIEEEQFNDETIRKTETILLNIAYDLASWRENIFIKQSAIDIHYLDASLLSSCMQLESIFVPDSENKDDNEIEFF